MKINKCTIYIFSIPIGIFLFCTAGHCTNFNDNFESYTAQRLENTTKWNKFEGSASAYIEDWENNYVLVTASTTGQYITETYDDVNTASSTFCVDLQIDTGSTITLRDRNISSPVFGAVIDVVGWYQGIIRFGYYSGGDYSYRDLSKSVRPGDANWLKVCAVVDCSTDTYDIYVDNVLIADNMVVYSNTCTTIGRFEFTAYPKSTNYPNAVVYIDNVSEYTAEETQGSSLTWFFPQQDYVLNNSEWNDWGLYYDLDAGDIGDFNALMVFYTDVNNYTYRDYELISTTTDLTYWTLDRSNALPDGLVYSYATISKITGCTNWYDNDCTWEDVAETNIITWTASTTGKTIFDYGVSGFTPLETDYDTICDDIATSSFEWWDSSTYAGSFRYAIECSFRKLTHWAFKPSSSSTNYLISAKNDLTNSFPFSVFFDLTSQVNNALATTTTATSVFSLPMINNDGNYYMMPVISSTSMSNAIGQTNTNIFRETLGYLMYVLTGALIFIIVYVSFF